MDRDQAVALVQPIWVLYFPIAVPRLLTVYFGLLLSIVGLWLGKWLSL